MRTMRRVGVALLTALALSTPVFAQSSDNRVSLNAAIGPSFATRRAATMGMGERHWAAPVRPSCNDAVTSSSRPLKQT